MEYWGWNYNIPTYPGFFHSNNQQNQAQQNYAACSSTFTEVSSESNVGPFLQGLQQNFPQQGCYIHGCFHQGETSSIIQCGTTVGDLNLPSNLTERQKKWLILCEQRKRDEEFINRFVNSKIVSQNETTTMKICEFSELTREAAGLIAELEKLRENFSKSPNDKPSSDELIRIDEIKERLSFVMEQISDPDTIRTVKQKLDKRKKKRDWMKRKKMRLKQETEQIQEKRLKLEKEIDEWRNKIHQQFLKERRDKETCREADLVLGEVRRKQAEAKKALDLFEALVELRRLRARSVQVQHALYSTEESNIQFSRTIGQLTEFMNKQLKDYDKEEQTLRAMMDLNDVKEDEKDTDFQKHWNRYRRMGSD